MLADLRNRYVWLGVFVHLAWLTGCNSIVPMSHDNPNAVPIAQSAPRAILGAPETGIVRTQLAENAQPTMPRSGGMTFNEAVSDTLVADPKIRAGFELIAQARGDLVTSSLRPNPSVLVDGLMLNTRPISPQNTSGPTQFDTFLSFPVDWFLFGKRTAAMASARVGVHQAEADYAELIRQRVLACAIAFYDIVEAKEVRRLAEQDLANMKRVEAITEKSFKAGIHSRLDLQRVQLDVLKSAQAVRDADTAVQNGKARLRALLGRSDHDPAFDVSGDLEAAFGSELLPVEQAYALAIENRPDIQSLHRQVEKAEADIVVQKRKAFPEMTPAFGFTRQFQGQALNQQNADTWNVSMVTTVPIFNRNQGNRMKAESLAAQTRFNMDAGLANLRAEVTQAHQDLQTAEKNARAFGPPQIKAAKEVMDVTIKTFDVPGGTNYGDVLDSQRIYLEANRAYITARANYWRAVYRFSAAVGKQIASH